MHGARDLLDEVRRVALRGLRTLGFTDVVRVPFQGELEGQSLAAFFVGTAGLGRTIEGNRSSQCAKRKPRASRDVLRKTTSAKMDVLPLT